MIERFPEPTESSPYVLWYAENQRLILKINELIDAYNGEPVKILICPHCGSEVWEDTCRSTLMGGPMNYYTYTCKQCGKNTKVKRIETPRDRRVYLGPEDEVMT